MTYLGLKRREGKWMAAAPLCDYLRITAGQLRYAVVHERPVTLPEGFRVYLEWVELHAVEVDTPPISTQQRYWYRIAKVELAERETPGEVRQYVQALSDEDLLQEAAVYEMRWRRRQARGRATDEDRLWWKETKQEMARRGLRYDTPGRICMMGWP